jgi:hypothetical protein
MRAGAKLSILRQSRRILTEETIMKSLIVTLPSQPLRGAKWQLLQAGLK